MERGTGGGGRGGVVLMSCMAVVARRWPLAPQNAGTEHVGFLSTRQTLLATPAERREVLGASHEG